MELNVMIGIPHIHNLRRGRRKEQEILSAQVAVLGDRSDSFTTLKIICLPSRVPACAYANLSHFHTHRQLAAGQLLPMPG